MKKNIFAGQSLFEVVLALAVVTLITVGIIILTTDSIKNSSFSKNKTLASRFAQEAIEWIRKERDKNFSTFLGHAAIPTYCFDTLTWSNIGPCSSSEKISGTILTREVDFTTYTVSGKNIVEALVVVSWSDSKGYHESRSSTNFNDLREK